MPTYEYVCTDCQNQWEEIQKISEAPLDVCPKCGKSTAKRQISGGNFILKGGGWYADLYSSSPKKGGESKSDGPSCEKVVDNMMAITKAAMPAGHDGMAMQNRKQMLDQCEARKMSAEQRTCLVDAKDITQMAACSATAKRQ